MGRLNLISFYLQLDFLSPHRFKTGQIKLMHIKAFAPGKDLTSPVSIAKKKNTLVAILTLRNMRRGEKGNLDKLLPPHLSWRLIVSLASQSHYGNAAHSSMPQPLLALNNADSIWAAVMVDCLT